MKISPSMLACDFSRMGEEAASMQQAGADMLHLDVMDGHFVPNLSFGAPVIKPLRGTSTLMFDVHLMISDPLRYLDDFVEAGADHITFHLESDSDADQTLDRIRAHGVGAGLSIRPATPAHALIPYLDRLDMVLIMTVEPGFGGQSFMEDQMEKLVLLNNLRKEHSLNFLLQVDGGIDDRTAAIAAANGADVLVAGSWLFRQPDRAGAIRALKSAGQLK